MAKPDPLTLKELNELLPRIQATIASLQTLTGNLASGAARNGRRTPARSTPSASKYSRADGERIRTDILRALSGTKAKVGALADEINAPVAAVRYHLNVLRDEKKVGMTGARATAEWFKRGAR